MTQTSKKRINNLSRFLCQLLRHNPAMFELNHLGQGWFDINEIIKASSKSGHPITYKEILDIEATDNKGRYTISDKAIRCNYGHSFDAISLGSEPEAIPNELFHGTSIENLEKIIESGAISSMERQHVHLTANKDIALNTGKRHGEPTLISINAKQMVKDGLKIIKAEITSENKEDVYLCGNIPTSYINFIQSSDLLADK